MTDIITRARAALAGDLAATPWHELRAIIEGLVGMAGRLQRDCAELYQVIGVMREACQDSEAEQIIKALDNASAAANGLPRPHDDLLPFTLDIKPPGCPAPGAVSEAEVEAAGIAAAGSVPPDRVRKMLQAAAKARPKVTEEQIARAICCERQCEAEEIGGNCVARIHGLLAMRVMRLIGGEG